MWFPWIFQGDFPISVSRIAIMHWKMENLRKLWKRKIRLLAIVLLEQPLAGAHEKIYSKTFPKKPYTWVYLFKYTTKVHDLKSAVDNFLQNILIVPEQLFPCNISKWHLLSSKDAGSFFSVTVSRRVIENCCLEHFRTKDVSLRIFWRLRVGIFKTLLNNLVAHLF